MSVRAFLAVVFLLLGSACTSQNVSSSGSIPDSTIPASNADDDSRTVGRCNSCFDRSKGCIDARDYLIGLGDVLGIIVQRHDGLSGTVPVRRDGSVLPIRLDPVLEGDDMATNYAIHPGDVVTVPSRANTNLE